MRMPSKLATTIAQLTDAIGAVERAAPGTTRPLRAGKPAAAAQLAAYEGKLGRKLPPAYRAFLAAHDGYLGLNVFGDFASLKELGPRGRLRRQVAALAKADPDALAWDTILPIASVEDSSDFVYLERGGEVVAWFHDLDSERYPDLVSYLASRVVECHRLAKEAPQRLAERERSRARIEAARYAEAERAASKLQAASTGALATTQITQGAWRATELPRLHRRELRAVRELDDGSIAVAEEYDCGLRVWTREGTLVRTIELPAAASALARAGTRLLAVCGSQLAVIEDGAVVTTIACDEASELAVSPDQRTVAMFAGEQLVLFDARDPDQRAVHAAKPGGLAWCREGKAIAIAPFGRTKLTVLDVARGDVTALTLPGKGFAIAADPAARVLAVAGGHQIWRWDHTLGARPPLAMEQGAWIQFLAISPDRASLAASASGDIRVFRDVDGHQLARLEGSSRNARLAFGTTCLFEAGAALRCWAG